MPNEKTYSREFEEWVHAEDAGWAPPDSDIHFWLSAFVRLVREEAAVYCESHEREVYAAEAGAMRIAFNSICERFKLGEK